MKIELEYPSAKFFGNTLRSIILSFNHSHYKYINQLFIVLGYKTTHKNMTRHMYPSDSQVLNLMIFCNECIFTSNEATKKLDNINYQSTQFQDEISNDLYIDLSNDPLSDGSKNIFIIESVYRWQGVEDSFKVTHGYIKGKENIVESQLLLKDIIDIRDLCATYLSSRIISEASDLC